MRPKVLLLVLASAAAWNASPDANACASWCRWSDDNCLQPNKRDQCRGCEQCVAVIRAAELEKEKARAAELAAACRRPSGHPQDDTKKGCE
eukprot:3830903-Prymnesium_polylepis.1